MTEPDSPFKKPQHLTPPVAESLRRYWRSNIKLMGLLLAIWAVGGLGCGVLFADYLNQFSLGGYPLGFWFAQQGAILIFLALILVYAIVLNKLDHKHRDELQRLRANEANPSSDEGTVAP